MTLRYKIAGGILALVAVALSLLALVLSYNSACGPAPALAGETQLMKAIVYRCYGSPDVLEFADIEKPTAADNEVLVKVHAASVNPHDWHYMRGSPYIMRLGSGLGAPEVTRIGVDFAGTVEAVGKNVRRFEVGDEVFGGRTGAFAEYVTVGDDRAIALKPANMTFEQAAAVPIAAITALQALRDKGQIKAGQKVLINGASGGVGTFAVQIAKSFGAEVTGVCSTRNLEMVRSIGADHVIDYTREDFTKSGQRYDLIIDNVGNHSPLAYRDVLNPDGIFVMVGGAKGDWLGPLTNPLKALVLSPFLDQEFVLFLADLNQQDLTVLSDLMQSGKVTPVIDRRYRLNEVPAAMQYSEEGHARGKIVIALETQGDPAPLLSRVDHLVYATPDLDSGIARIEALLGVKATAGGRHPGRGTRNALISLGRSVYLEIIAPDPDQPQPAEPRRFGIDELAESKLVTWSAKGTEIERLHADAVQNGVPLGVVRSGSRQRPDGVLLTWQFTDAGALVADGIVPFFIDWGDSPHPAQTSPGGATLVALRAEHPDEQRVQQMLRQLGLDLAVTHAPQPALIAVIEGPRGRVELR